MLATPHKKNGEQWRRTFAQMKNETRWDAARRAWDRARVVSSFRHHAQSQQQCRLAKALGCVKQAAINRALQLAPEQIHVTFDTDYHVGLLSVRFNGRGRLHLPAAAEVAATCSLPPLAKLTA